MSRDWLKPGGLLSLVVLGALALALTTVGVSREVPVGSVTGVVRMEKDNQPLPNADVILTIKGDNDWEDRKIWRAATDEDGRFTLRGIPAQTYDVQIYGKVHSHQAVVQVLEGERVEESYVAKRSAPYLQMNAGSRVFLPDEEIALRFSGLSDEAGLDVRIYGVSDQDIRGAKNVSELLYGIASGINRQNPATMSNRTSVRDVPVTIDTRDIEGVFVKTEVLDSLEKGVYLVEAATKEDRAFAWLTVTEIALVTKTDSDDGVAYVTDLRTGEPIEGASVRVTSASGNQDFVATGGLAKIDGWRTTPQDRVVLVSATKEGSSAYTWFYNYGSSPSEQYRASTVFDRPIYRPGDTVHVKTTVRQRSDGEYVVPPAGAAVYELYDSWGEKVAEKPVTVDEFGTVAESFDIPATGETGSYSVELRYQGRSFAEYVSIASYRKPNFEVKVSPVRGEYVRGDTVKFLIECTSLTGEPVAGARMDASLYRSQDWYGSPFDDGYDPFWEEDYGYSGEYVNSFETTTNEDGKAVVEVNTRRFEGRDADYADQVLRLTADVEDAGGRYFSGEGKVRVRRAELDLRASMASYFIGEGDAVEAKVEGLGDLSRLNGAVTVEFGRMVYGRSDASFNVETKQTIRLGSGLEVFRLVPKRSGNYVLRVTGADRRGNRVSAEDWLWVSGPGSGQDATLPSLRVIPGADSYLPGDKAEVLVQSNQPGGSVLVTLEADDLLESRLVKMSGTEARVVFDIDAKHAPNVYVSAAMVKGKRFTESSRVLKVGRQVQELNLKVSPSKDDVRPGETVDYAVEATDYQGNPIVADVSVGVVDEGIYLIQEDRSDPLEDFYSRRWSGVNTAYSFPEIYLDGEDKSGQEIDLRTKFEDTAFWQPRVRTGTDGKATVRVTLPDNLTTWRTTATAVTRDTKVGKATAKVVSQKPVMARLSLPQFFVQGDEQAVTGYVVNGSDVRQTVMVRLTVIGGAAEGPSESGLELDPDETGSVTWRVKPSQAGEITFQMTAQGNGESDGLEMKVPVKTLGVAWRDQKSSRFAEGEAVEQAFSFDKPVERGTLTITVSPSLVSVLEGALDGLVDFPYGCVEQTISRFVPGVLVRAYLRENGISRPELESKIDEVTTLGLTRLRTMQHYSGAWGWFEYSQPEAQMTAVVLDGLWLARQNGVSIHDYMVNRGLEGAEELLNAAVPTDEVLWRTSGRMSLASAVLRWRESEAARKVLDAGWGQATPGAEQIAEAVLAWDAAWRRSGSSSDLGKRDRNYQALLAKGVGGGATLTFGDARASARALQAILAVEGAGERADQTMAGLMQNRQGRGWDNTWNTNYALQGAVAYARASGSGAASGVAEVWVTIEGETVREAVDLSDPTGKTLTYDLPQGATAASVSVSMTGLGRPYLSAVVDAELADARPSSVSRPNGFTVKREYFPMTVTRLENGRMARVTAQKPTTVLKAGEVFRCRLTIRTNGDLNYVAIEDPVPSNTRIVDADSPEAGFEWSNWWDKSSFYDDRAVFFVSRLGSGEKVIEYAIRAEADGVATALPTVAYPMYQPDVLARTGHLRLEVRR